VIAWIALVVFLAAGAGLVLWVFLRIGLIGRRDRD